jgi:hypothetical protein
MATAFILCSLGIGLTLVSFAIFRALVSRSADEGTLDEAIERSRLLHQGLLKLPDCKAEDRVSLSRAVVEGLVKNSRYLSHVLWQWRIQEQPRSKQERQEMGELRAAALGRAWKLNSRASKLSSRLRSKRARVNWESIAEAVLEHDEMWTSYFRLLKAEYPDKFAGVFLADESRDPSSSDSPDSVELPDAARAAIC